MTERVCCEMDEQGLRTEDDVEGLEHFTERDEKGLEGHAEGRKRTLRFARRVRHPESLNRTASYFAGATL
jgi:hypothetical protein